MINLSSCGGSSIPTTEDSSQLKKFHETFFKNGDDAIREDNLSLYVDYSTCISLGQNSPFFQALVPSWVNSAKEYYSIKGEKIQKEEGRTFDLLRNINEVNYADLKTALNTMADSKTESVLLTDGEYFQHSIAKGNINNPFMADALKTWLEKGHDVYIFSEPYSESYKGKNYNKKRFYIIFTDIRLKGNIYDRLVQTVDFSHYPNVKLFHLSADHPSLFANGNSSKPNVNLNATVKGYGSYEIQEWPIDWESIQTIIVNAVDPNKGTPLINGDSFTGGIKVDKNGFGGYKISDISIKVYNINQEYSNFCNGNKSKFSLTEYPNFIKVDENEFKRHGIINLHFDTNNFDPSILDGSPYNYFKIDICVANAQNIFNLYENMFTFESIDMPGEQNVSVEESVKQCLADPDIQSRICNCPLYSIYVQSPKF